MRLTCVNLPTMDLPRMRDFYCMALKVGYDESHGGPDRCEILTQGATLVLCKTHTPPVIDPESCGLEFQVENVDEEYQRLLDQGVTIPNPPLPFLGAFGLLPFGTRTATISTWFKPCKENPFFTEEKGRRRHENSRR